MKIENTEVHIQKFTEIQNHLLAVRGLLKEIDENKELRSLWCFIEEITRHTHKDLSTINFLISSLTLLSPNDSNYLICHELMTKMISSVLSGYEVNLTKDEIMNFLEGRKGAKL